MQQDRFDGLLTLTSGPSLDLLQQMLTTFIDTIMSASRRGLRRRLRRPLNQADQQPQRLQAPGLRLPRRHSERAMTTEVATCYLLG